MIRKIFYLIILFSCVLYPQRILLSWEGGDPDSADVVKYTVYWFGTDSTSMPIIIGNDLLTTHCPSPVLIPFTKYYWQVVATDSHYNPVTKQYEHLSTAGKLWNFSTGGIIIGLEQPNLHIHKK